MVLLLDDYKNPCNKRRTSSSSSRRSSFCSDDLAAIHLDLMSPKTLMSNSSSQSVNLAYTP